MLDKFVLLASPRSGSTWIVDLLNSHPQLVMYSELFVRTAKERPTFAGDKNILLWNAYYWRIPGIRRRLLRPYYTYRYLQEVYAGKGDWDADVRGVGFKLMYGDVRRHIAIPVYLRMKRVPVVHLVRRNYLDAFISMEVARKRNVFHASSSEELTTLHLDPRETRKRLDAILAERNKFRNRLAKSGLPSMEVAYEDVREGEEPLKKIQEFLQLDYVSLNSDLQKQINKGQRELIDNYDELAAALKGTDHGELLRP